MMPAVMSSSSSHSHAQPHHAMTQPHSAISQSDLDILNLLTSSDPQPSTTVQTQNGRKKMGNRRDPVLDSLLLTAVLAGSGPVTRHHVGHGAPGAYSTCDQSRPSSPGRPQPRPLPRSQQAPRSIRLKKEAEAAAAAAAAAAAVPAGGVQAESSSGTAARLAVPPAHGSNAFSSPEPVPTSVRKRRMSVDPQPISQILQLASPAHTNFYHGRGQVLSKPQGRATVRCMARTRVPTPHGDIFLHLYHNTHDNKEHLAIVTDPIQLDPAAKAAAPRGRREIRSRSLDACWRDGETEMERIVRGAYVGRLHAGEEGTPTIPRSQAEYDAEEAARLEIAEPDVPPLVRIHSECFTGETIGSMRCDCGEQLDEAMRRIAEPQRLATIDEYMPTPDESRAPSPGPGSSQAGGRDTSASTTGGVTDSSSESSGPASNSGSAHRPTGKLVPGRGVVIYMRQEGRGIGLLEKIRAYNLQDLGHDTVTANLMLGHGADERSYAVAAEILRDLGLAPDAEAQLPNGTTTTTSTSTSPASIRLLTNNPEKVEGLAAEGVAISERVGMIPRDWQCQHEHAHKPDVEMDDEEAEYDQWRSRRAGVGLLGATTTRSVELDKYLKTKIERMGHMIDIPEERH